MKIRSLLVGFVLLILAACGGESIPEATATLRGAIVPTRASPTPSITPSPSPTPTTDFTATAETIATADAFATSEAQETLDAQSTADTVATLRALATLESQSTLDAQATIDMQATLDILSTATAEARMTLDALSTLDEQATIDAVASQNAQATETQSAFDAGATFEAQADLDDVATMNAIGTTDAVATQQAASIPTATPPIEVTSEPTVLEIAYGETLTGFIDNTHFAIEYSFEAQTGDVVSINLVQMSGDLDPFLALIGPDGLELTSNDDRPDGLSRDSQIENFTIEQGGTHIIRATRFSQNLGSTTGEFRLTLTAESAAGVPTPVPGQQLAYGSSGTGTITNEVSRVEFTFSGSAGDVISLQMIATSGDLDTFIALLDPGGSEIINNDDDSQTGTTDSAIRNFTLPDTGTYTIVATRFNRDIGLSTGDFELSLDQVDVGQNVAISPAGSIELGETIIGQINNDDYFQTYAFEGQAGQTITVTMNGLTNDLDPFLLILDPSGREMARNDDRIPGNTNSVLDNITLPVDGTYLMVAARYNKNFGLSTGNFELEVLESSGETTIAYVTIPISIGASVTGEITEEQDAAIYTFSGDAGDLVRIELTALDSSFDGQLAFEDSFGNRLRENDDNVLADNVSDPMLEVLLPAGGFYTVIAAPYTDSDGNYTPGQFELSLSLQGNAAVNGRIPQRAALHTLYSFGDRADGGTVIYHAAGDWTDDADTDHMVAALLTYALPEISGEIELATFDFSSCYLTVDSVFDQFGTLTVRLNATFASNQELDSVETASAPVVTQVNECTSVDVTDLVRAAYADGMQYVQFRLAFEEGTVIANNELDSVIFANPYLEILPAS